MKNIVGIFLSAALFVSLSAPAYGVTDAEADSWMAPDSGFEIHVPDSYQNAKGYVYFTDLGEGVNPGSGVVQAVSAYVSMPRDEYKALKEEQMEAYENDDLEKLNETVEKISGVEWSLFTVYGINRNRGENELRNILTGQVDLNPDNYGGDEELVAAIGALYENMQYREIGEKDGLR